MSAEDKNIKRVAELIAQGEALIQKPESGMYGAVYVNYSGFHGWRAQTINCLDALFGSGKSGAANSQKYPFREAPATTMFYAFCNAAHAGHATGDIDHTWAVTHQLDTPCCGQGGSRHIRYASRLRSRDRQLRFKQFHQVFVGGNPSLLQPAAK